MREIKFRYIHKRKSDGKVWLEIVTLKQFEEAVNTKPFRVDTMIDFNQNREEWKIISRNLFTGLKDKNGKEIFEGDILQLRKDSMWVNPKPKVIKWDNELCGFFPFIEKNDECYSGEWETENFEVIGNKFENPELLEVEE